MACKDSNGANDTYIIFTYGGQHTRSTTARKSISPYWGEEIKMVLTPEMNTTLGIQAYDEHKFLRGDLIGQSEIDLTALWEEPNKFCHFNACLIGKRLKNAGELHLEVCIAEKNN